MYVQMCMILVDLITETVKSSFGCCVICQDPNTTTETRLETLLQINFWTRQYIRESYLRVPVITLGACWSWNARGWALKDKRLDSAWNITICLMIWDLPVHPIPPHCPHFDCCAPPLEAVVVVVVGGVRVVVWTCRVVVVSALRVVVLRVVPPILVVVETGRLVEVGWGADPPHPIRLELTTTSSYQIVLVSPP